MPGALVTTEWLEAHLGDANVRILESSVEKATYDDGHIPGAFWVEPHVDLLRNGDESSGLVLTPEQFASLMSRQGVTPEMTVVWYGDRHSSYAIRGFWTLDFYRHRGGLYVLEGGRECWQREGRRMTRDVAAPQSTNYPVPASADGTNRAHWRDVRSAIGDSAAVVLDVRARDEYEGTNVRAARGGHVPGAVHIEWTEAAAGPNALKSAEELRELFEGAGVTPGRRVVTQCQLGIRAAHTWFILKHVLGYPDVRLYDGSWQEWGNREDLPIER